jgi:very-short-patch-repair endonuclease
MKAEYVRKNKATCLHCKREYVIPTNTVEKGKRRYCSRNCMFSYWAKNAKFGAMSMEEALFNHGLRASRTYARKQYNPLAAFTSVDFYVPSLKLCIYVDGVYWHGRPGVKERDRRQDKILKAAGFKVLRISDLKVRKLGVDGVKNLIEKMKGASLCLKAI